MKSVGCLFKVLGVCFAIVLVGMLLSKPSERQPHSVTPAPLDPDIVQVGHFTGGRMNGFTFFVRKPTPPGIRAYCDALKRKYIDESSEQRVLQAHFFDRREATPDVTTKYEFPDASLEHEVASYFFNPFNGRTELIFHEPGGAPLKR